MSYSLGKCWVKQRVGNFTGAGWCDLLSFLLWTGVAENPLWGTLMWSQLTIFR